MELPANFNTITVVVLAGMMFFLLRYLDRRWGPRITKIDDCDYESKIVALEERIEWLLTELHRAMVRIHELEQQTNVPQRITPAKPLLLICGPDNALCGSDRSALRRAQVSFQRLVEATQAEVTEEFQRRRQDDTLYTWVHITAHATHEGIHLAGGVTTPAFWNETLIGIKVVFLAACQTAAVADALAGMVTVVYVLEDIENRDASAFTYAFWRRMREHGDPVRAYRQAVNEAPQVAEFTDIRTG